MLLQIALYLGLSQRAVAAMFGEALGVLNTNRRDCHPQRLDQSLTGAGLGSSQDALDLRPLIFEKASSMGLRSGE